MNIYLIILLSYTAFIFLMGVACLKISLGNIRRFSDFMALVVASLAWLAIIPIGILIWPVFLYKILNEGRWKVKSKFEIAPLTEANKIALRQIGFQEGKFVSFSNIEYEGFRYKYGRITVCNDGRVCVWDKYIKDGKHLVELIKNLPQNETIDKVEE